MKRAVMAAEVLVALVVVVVFVLRVRNAVSTVGEVQATDKAPFRKRTI